MTILQQLNLSEEEAIEELRNRTMKDMTPEMHQDTMMFYRFLKARDFNIDNSEIMLKNHLKWRKEFKVDTILKDFQPPEVLVKYFPGSFIGLDKDGCPVKYYPFGNINGKGIRKSRKFIDIVRYIIYMIESEVTIINREAESRGKPLLGTTVILDMKNLSFTEATDRKSGEHAIYLLKLYQDNYPERLKAAYVINVSSYFMMVFKFLKVFLASAILNKVTMCTPEQEQSELLKVIDEDVLPAFLGGQRTDPDGDKLCRSFVHFCGKVPEQYFMSKAQSGPGLAAEPDVRKLTVSRLSLSEIEVDVEKPDSLIAWEFETKGARDVVFGILFRQEGHEDKVVVPLIKLDMEDCVEVGNYQCETPGKYVLVFDNSYSWFRSKELYYRVKVTTAEEMANVDPL